MIPDCSVLRTPAIIKNIHNSLLVQALLASDFQTLDTGIIK